MKIRIIYVAVFILLGLTISCTRIICGEPKGSEKELMDSLNLVYKDVFISNPAPCYPGYYEIYLNTRIDSLTFKHLDSLLKTKGFNELLVYDKSGVLIWGEKRSM